MCFIKLPSNQILTIYFFKKLNKLIEVLVFFVMQSSCVKSFRVKPFLWSFLIIALAEIHLNGA